MSKLAELYRLLIFLFVSLLMLQFLSGVLLFGLKMGFSPDAITDYFLGGGANGGQPKTLTGQLEVVLPHLLSVGITVFILAHLLMFDHRLGSGTRSMLGAGLGAFAAIHIISGILIVSVSPAFSYMKLIGFLGFEVTLFVSSISLMASALRGLKRT